MTALLELKQKIKNLYGQYEVYILPVLRFVLGLVYFFWINANMGYMTQLNNVFLVVILALICSILPSGVMLFVGFALMIAHGYALGIEVAGFLLVLILFMTILFLRFSVGNNIVLVFTPLSFGFSVPTLLPIGAGLLGSAASALPAGCGVILYYPFPESTESNAGECRCADDRQAETSGRWNRTELGYVDHSDCIYCSNPSGEPDPYPFF